MTENMATTCMLKVTFYFMNPMQLYQYLIDNGLVGGTCSNDPNDPKYIFSNKMAIILMLKLTTFWSVALAVLAQKITSNNIVIIKKNIIIHQDSFKNKSIPNT